MCDINARIILFYELGGCNFLERIKLIIIIQSKHVRNRASTGQDLESLSAQLNHTLPSPSGISVIQSQ